MAKLGLSVDFACNIASMFGAGWISFPSYITPRLFRFCKLTVVALRLNTITLGPV